MLLTLRVERLKNPRAHSQQPRSRCQHVLQRSMRVDAADGDDRAHELRTPFLYVESRDGEQVLLTGLYRHWLVNVEGAWKIRLKRVDLLDADRPLPAIQLFI
jgi:3-phenylpropionate/cinnamic acid dioxygenase small subunit